MTELQKYLMQLVKEIDEVCKESDISYALSGRSAGCAAEYGKFTTPCASFQIMVPAKDVLRLKEALLKKNVPERGIEDMSNNPKLAFNYIRYVDTGTTFIDKDNPVRYRLCGIAVTIVPVFADGTSKYIRVLENGTMFLNGGTEYPGLKRLSKIKLYISYTQILRKLIGDERVAKKIYSVFSKSRNMDFKDRVYIWKGDGKKSYFSADMVLDTNNIEFEQMSLPVPKKLDAYLKAYFGKNWETESRKPFASAGRIAVLADTSMSYAEYMRLLREETGIDMDRLLDEYSDYYYWFATDYTKIKKKTGHKYDHALRSVDRIDLYCQYKDQMEEMREAAKQLDYKKLRDILAQYFSLTDKYLKKGMGFFINQEIFDYAKLVWQKDGKSKYADKVYRKVPRAYKQENIEDFLSKYC